MSSLLALSPKAGRMETFKQPESYPLILPPGLFHLIKGNYLPRENTKIFADPVWSLELEDLYNLLPAEEWKRWEKVHKAGNEELKLSLKEGLQWAIMSISDWLNEFRCNLFALYLARDRYFAFERKHAITTSERVMERLGYFDRRHLSTLDERNKADALNGNKIDSLPPTPSPSPPPPNAPRFSPAGSAEPTTPTPRRPSLSQPEAPLFSSSYSVRSRASRQSLDSGAVRPSSTPLESRRFSSSSSSVDSRRFSNSSTFSFGRRSSSTSYGDDSIKEGRSTSVERSPRFGWNGHQRRPSSALAIEEWE